MSSKLEKLLKSTGSNMDSSMGAGRAARPLHGSTAPAAPASNSGKMAGVSRSKDAAEIPVARICRDPEQPREDFDEESLERLAHSLKTRGQLQPIRVRWDDMQESYVIISGERRWRAARLAGLETLSCVVMERPAGAGELLALQLIENALREDLTGMEQAKAYRALMDLNGWSTRQLAAELAINSGTVTRALALLDLPTPVQEKVEQGGLSPAAAYEVTKIADPVAQAEVAQAAVEQKLTRAEVAATVQAIKSKRPAVISKPEPVTIDLGDVVVTVKWKREGSNLTQALQRAIDTQLQEGAAA